MRSNFIYLFFHFVFFSTLSFPAVPFCFLVLLMALFRGQLYFFKKRMFLSMHVCVRFVCLCLCMHAYTLAAWLRYDDFFTLFTTNNLWFVVLRWLLPKKSFLLGLLLVESHLFWTMNNATLTLLICTKVCVRARYFSSTITSVFGIFVKWRFFFLYPSHLGMFQLDIHKLLFKLSHGEKERESERAKAHQMERNSATEQIIRMQINRNESLPNDISFDLSQHKTAWMYNVISPIVAQPNSFRAFSLLSHTTKSLCSRSARTILKLSFTSVRIQLRVHFGTDFGFDSRSFRLFILWMVKLFHKIGKCNHFKKMERKWIKYKKRSFCFISAWFFFVLFSLSFSQKFTRNLSSKLLTLILIEMTWIWNDAQFKRNEMKRTMFIYAEKSIICRRIGYTLNERKMRQSW